MVEHRKLPTLECLEREDPPYIVEIAIGFLGERLLERLSAGHRPVDGLGIHVVAEFEADAPDPRQGRDFTTHVVRHQEGEVGGAPVGRQPEADIDQARLIHRDAGDETEFGDALVEFRVVDPGEPDQHLAGPVAVALDRHVIRHVDYSAATRSSRPSLAFCSSTLMS